MIAVGPGAPDKDGKIVPTNVRAGDRVLLPGWGGNSLKVGEEVRYYAQCARVGVFEPDNGSYFSLLGIPHLS